MNVFTKLGQTFVNLLGAVDTTVNMANRIVNTADNYVQTVERHAMDYNFESEIVSAKRKQELSEKYRLLDEDQLKKLREARDFKNPFEVIAETTH